MDRDEQRTGPVSLSPLKASTTCAWFGSDLMNDETVRTMLSPKGAMPAMKNDVVEKRKTSSMYRLGSALSIPAA